MKPTYDELLKLLAQRDALAEACHTVLCDPMSDSATERLARAHAVIRAAFDTFAPIAPREDEPVARAPMRKLIYEAIDAERDYQYRRWGYNPHEVGGWLTILRHLLTKAEAAWCGDGDCNQDALHEVRKLAAVAVACGEQHGLPTRRKG
jgi:hypothetical protein